MVIAKFRLSSHCLTVETGQYTGKKNKNKNEMKDYVNFVLKLLKMSTTLNWNFQLIINLGNNFKPYY